MGCDIHVFLEHVNYDGTEWISPQFYPRRLLDLATGNPDAKHWDAFYVETINGGPPFQYYVPRNYQFFAGLADVRGNGYRNLDTGEQHPALFPGRGIPTNLNPALVDQVWGNQDYHSHTWFTVAELREHRWFLENVAPPVVAELATWLMELRTDHDETKARFIVAFDS